MSRHLVIAMFGLLSLAATGWDFSVPAGETRSIFREVNEDWRHATQMNVNVVGEHPMSFRVILVDKNGFWYQSRAQSSESLSLSLLGPGDWESPGDLRRPFGRDSLRWIQRWGIKIRNAGPEPLAGNLAMGLERGEIASLGPSALQYPKRVEAGEVAEFHVEHLPFVPGPEQRLTLRWSHEGVSGEARFFPLQRFQRVEPPFRDAHVTALGRSVWAARWVPPEPGSYALSWRLNGQPFGPTSLRPFSVTPAAGEAPVAPGEDAARFMGFAGAPLNEWRDGEWLKIEVQPICWQAQLEWTSDWGDYLGAGVYNQRLAWELEQAIKAHEVAMPIRLFSDDELDNQGTFNWPEHPLNAANGGPLVNPGEFFKSEDALQSVDARAHYLINRYASFPQTKGLLIDLRHPAADSQQWASTLAARLRAEFPDVPIYCASRFSAQPSWVAPLSTGESWKVAKRLSTVKAELSRTQDGLRIQTRGAGAPAIISRRVPHLAHASTLSFTVDPSAEFADALRVMVMLKSEDGEICQSPLLALKGDFSHRFELPLDDLAYWTDADGNPTLADRRQLASMQEVIIRFFCDSATRLDLTLGDVELRGAASDEERPVLGPFDGAWQQPVVRRVETGWEAQAEQPSSIWNPILDWSADYGRALHVGAAREFERALAAHKGPAKPLLLFSEDELDDTGLYNWGDHPLNKASGGPLKRVERFYRESVALDAIVGRAELLLQRFGDSPAVDGLLVDLRYRHAGSEAWVERLGLRLAEAYPGVTLLCNSQELQKRAWQESIEIAADWTLVPALSAGAFLQPDADAHISQLAGGDSAILEARQMAVVTIAQENVLHWAHASAFSCIVKPSLSCDDTRLTAVLRTDDGRLFESPLLKTYGDYPHRMVFPLDEADYWRALNGDRPFIPALDLLNVHQLLLRVFNLPAGEAKIVLSDTRLSGPRLAESAGELAISGLQGDEEKCEQFTRFELDFQLSRSFRNPYDPDEIAVDLRITDPDGEEVVHPGFYWEDWSLHLDDGVERVSKGQESAWKVLFTPQKVGRYQWTLTARSQAGTAAETGAFRCTPGKGRGFVVISPQDPRCFEFSNGEFFYPIGHNLRSPSDRREGAYSSEVLDNCTWAERAGTYAFESWFKRMAENGENFARTWMTAWWLGLEWTPAYPGYHGLGFYNQGNAKRVDRLLELAETHGIYLNLELMNHGAISSKVDTEWGMNPLNRKRGGFLRGPAEALRDEQAQKLHTQRLRYVAARWGYSPAIAFWGTVTEAEWADAYGKNRGVYGQWLDAYGKAIRTHNAAHPQAVTTHFSYPGRAGSVWSKDHLQITHTNAYDTMRQANWRRDLFDYGYGIADRLFAYGKGLEHYPQPLLVGEWGGNHLRNRDSHLLAELHTGLWASFMTNSSGATGFWWWNLIDHRQLYDRFQALANFAKGEDRRGKAYRSQRGKVSIQKGDDDTRVRAVTLSNQSELFAYVYTGAVNRFKDSVLVASRTDEQLPLIHESFLMVPDTMKWGSYQLEFWDTFTGKVFSKGELEIDSDSRAIALPPYSTDLALKLRRLSPERTD